MSNENSPKANGKAHPASTAAGSGVKGRTLNVLLDGVVDPLTSRGLAGTDLTIESLNAIQRSASERLDAIRSESDVTRSESLI